MELENYSEFKEIPRYVHITSEPAQQVLQDLKVGVADCAHLWRPQYNYPPQFANTGGYYYNFDTTGRRGSHHGVL